MPPDIRRFCRRLFHSIVTHFLTDANNFFAFFKIFLPGLIRNLCISAAFFQKPENTGRSSLPAVHSQRIPPAKRPEVQPGRISPPQTEKLRISHPQKAARTKSRSERPVHLGRRGRRNPYTTPRPQPMTQAARKCPRASPGAVIGSTGSASRRLWVLHSSMR